jgi:ABC-2 type transport system permease protein
VPYNGKLGVGRRDGDIVAVFFVIPTLTLPLPASLTDHFVQCLPSNFGGALTGESSGLAHALAPWSGFGLLCGYAAVLIGFAAWRLSRADA